ncbi:MAG: ribosome maturation factor RimP [bacterium]
MYALSKKLQEIVTPTLAEEGVDLVDLDIKGKPGSLILKFFVDIPEGGITLHLCQRISRRLSDDLDILDVIPGKYRMEVSSPGVSRPLKKPADFTRNLNRDIKLTFEDDIGVQEFQGVITSVNDKSVRIAGEKQTKEIPFSFIKKGQLTLPW